MELHTCICTAPILMRGAVVFHCLSNGICKTKEKEHTYSSRSGESKQVREPATDTVNYLRILSINSTRNHTRLSAKWAGRRQALRSINRATLIGSKRKYNGANLSNRHPCLSCTYMKVRVAEVVHEFSRAICLCLSHVSYVTSTLLLLCLLFCILFFTACWYCCSPGAKSSSARFTVATIETVPHRKWWQKEYAGRLPSLSMYRHDTKQHQVHSNIGRQLRWWALIKSNCSSIVLIGSKRKS